ncbi:MAG: capsular biosynthesis protein [Bacteroidetes bacterium]|nr:MAG: capsular biosynthesis protein [Bacteroidota bacterium]
MGFFDRFKKKVLPPFDLALIGVDMHSHLIPAIDDGSKSMEQTLVMLAKFESMGFRKVITTPHIISDTYKNTPENILSGLNAVREAATNLGLTIEIEAAAEYYYDETLLQKLKNGEELLTFGDKMLLFEFSFHSEPVRTEELFFELKTRGYKPVLAHFERYLYYLGKPEIANSLRENGVLIQLNLNSLSGHYGPEIKKQAEALIDNGWVDFVGTDCHRIEHLMLLESNLNNAYMHKLESITLQNQFLS